jgi:type II secretory pathway pseudopilin PulG
MSKVYITHRETEAGFTLPGLLAGLVIFTVLGLGMLQLTSEVYYRRDQHRETVVATALAQSMAEELVGAGYDDPRLRDPDGGEDVAQDAAEDAVRDPNNFLDPDHADPNNPLDSEGGAIGARRFTRVWNVGDDVPLSGVKTVTVLVGWHDSRGNQQVVSQTFQIARLK